MGLTKPKGGPTMKRRLAKITFSILLVLSVLFLILLILSDFGLIFPTTNTDARLFQHLTALILIGCSVVELKRR